MVVNLKYEFCYTELMIEAHILSEDVKLTEEEPAFYDAFDVKINAVKVMGVSPPPIGGTKIHRIMCGICKLWLDPSEFAEPNRPCRVCEAKLDFNRRVDDYERRRADYKHRLNSHCGRSKEYSSRLEVHRAEGRSHKEQVEQYKQRAYAYDSEVEEFNRRYPPGTLIPPEEVEQVESWLARLKNELNQIKAITSRLLANKSRLASNLEQLNSELRQLQNDDNLFRQESDRFRMEEQELEQLRKEIEQRERLRRENPP